MASGPSRNLSVDQPLTVGAPVAPEKETPRLCRVSMARTVGTVRRALRSASYITGQSMPDFQPTAKDCSTLSKEIKAFLKGSNFVLPEDNMVFQSIKKILPDSCRCQEKGLLASLRTKLTSPPPKTAQCYIRFVKNQTEKLFPAGWDKGYSACAEKFTPNLSSTMESSRAEPGFAAHVDHADFLDQVLGSENPRWDFLAEAELILVQSAGKPRPLTKFSEDCNYLGPFHKAMYNRLSKEKWLLRGDPREEIFARAGFLRKAGQTLVSGDYESATDNLRLDVAEAILSVVCKNARYIPGNVTDYAMRILRPSIHHDGETFTPLIGQMMGSYLSFPLLCMQNYFAFSYAQYTAVRKGLIQKGRIPLLINGDDILFQCDPKFAGHWMKVVGGLGLKVETTKTSVEAEYGSINSTLVRWKEDGELRVVDTARLGMLRPSVFPHNLGRAFGLFVRGSTRKLACAIEFLRWHRHDIERSQISASKLGFRGRLFIRAAKKVGLWGREERISELGIENIGLAPAPCPHNIVLSKDDVVSIPKDAFAGEVAELQAREMASAKWAMARTFKRRSAELSWWVDHSAKVNAAMTHSSQFHEPRFLLSDEVSRCANSKARFLLPPPPPRETVDILFGVWWHFAQDDSKLGMCFSPPDYEEGAPPPYVA